MPYIGNEVGNRFVASKAASVYSGNGSTTAFTLEHAVGSDEDILVSVDGVIQEPSVAYAVSSGTTLTFTAAPSSNSGNNIFVYYLFRTVATVEHPSTSSLQATDGTFSGAVTANAGVSIDNITIDGTEIDLSSGDLTVDVAGDIILDVDTRNVKLQDCGTDWGRFTRDTTTSPTAFVIDAPSNNVAVKFKGNDGGSAITALHLDMSDAGTALFNHDIKMPNGGNIYFLASSGYSPIISNSSDTNSLSFFTGNNQRMNIDGNGHVTMPTQPAFLAHKNGTAQTNLTTGTDVTITFGTERFDNNSDFASNTFTAPVTGKYFLSVTLYLNQVDSGANYIILGIETSNQQYRTIIDNNDLFGNDADYHHMTSTALVDVDASDTAHVMVHQSGGAAQLGVNGSANYTYFTGYLVA